MIRQFLGATLALSCAFACTGCREINEASSEDAGSLRQRVQVSQPVALPAATWMPSGPTHRWRTRFQARKPSADANEFDRVEEVRGTGVRLRGGRRMVGLLAVGADGRSSREEWYVDRPEGRCLSEAGGGADRLVFEPPFPVLPAKAVPGNTVPWSGTVRFAGRATPANGYVRFRGFEPIATSEGQRDAACVETVLIAGGTGAGALRLPMVRWFLPKVGAVRVWFKSGDTEYLRETIAFRQR
ncbi:MAG: hypothetical protein ACKO5K_06710 [Armatimonadota bacterium]